MQKLSILFGVDLRSLAAFRIGAALVILCDLLFRSRELTAYFTDAGVLPRIARIELYETADQFRSVDMWSLHLLSGQFWVQALLMVAAAAAAICLLVGYRTRLAAVVSWLLLLSLDSRNPLLVNSGDVLLRCMLLWSLFLPLGARFSLDRIADRHSRGPRAVSVASAAIMLQLSMMYFFSALFKFHDAWLTECSAVYYALNCDAYLTQFGQWLRERPVELHKALTLATFVLEFAGPIIVFSPWKTAILRLITTLVFWGFHVGLALTLTIGLFPPICMVGWLVFLPTEFWDYLARRLPTGLGRYAAQPGAAGHRPCGRRPRRRPESSDRQPSTDIAVWLLAGQRHRAGGATLHHRLEYPRVEFLTARGGRDASAL